MIYVGSNPTGRINFLLYYRVSNLIGKGLSCHESRCRIEAGLARYYGILYKIQGNRSGTLYGLIATVILAIIFTAFQGIDGMRHSIFISKYYLIIIRKSCHR